MSRPLRIEFAHGLYHVTSRGDGREAIYFSDADRELFLEVLSDTCERYNWVIHAYCLMSNHYHLLIETPDGNLSKGMRQLNGVYTQRLNRKHGRVGHVFQGRYKAIIVQQDSYLQELARYIVLNPVRAQMVRVAEEWLWSSYRATAAMVPCPVWLRTDPILSAFGQQRAQALSAYREFVAAGMGLPTVWTQLKNQIYLGTDEFVEQMQIKTSASPSLSEIPAAQRRKMSKPLEEYAQVYPDRDEAIEQAYASGGYGMKEIGEYFGLHYSRVSRILAKRRWAKSKT